MKIKTADLMKRIEDKAADAVANFRAPTKILLGKREVRQLTKMFYPRERIQLFETPKKADIAAIYVKKATMDIVRTKHKSYLRVI